MGTCGSEFWCSVTWSVTEMEECSISLVTPTVYLSRTENRFVEQDNAFHC